MGGNQIIAIIVIIGMALTMTGFVGGTEFYCPEKGATVDGTIPPSEGNGTGATGDELLDRYHVRVIVRQEMGKGAACAKPDEILDFFGIEQSTLTCFKDMNPNKGNCISYGEKVVICLNAPKGNAGVDHRFAKNEKY